MATNDNNTNDKPRSLFIVPPGMMSKRDIARAEKMAHICIVECEKPAEVRVLEGPLPGNIGAQAAAALQVFRYVVDNSGSYTNFAGSDLQRMFLKLVLNSAVPQPVQKVGK